MELLLVLSFITIIGWAWVLKLMMQWVCKEVRGAPGFEFTATGLSVLWRTLVLDAALRFFDPDSLGPALVRELVFSQISVTDPRASRPARAAGSVNAKGRPRRPSFVLTGTINQLAVVIRLERPLLRQAG